MLNIELKFGQYFFLNPCKTTRMLDSMGCNKTLRLGRTGHGQKPRQDAIKINCDVQNDVVPGRGWRTMCEHVQPSLTRG